MEAQKASQPVIREKATRQDASQVAPDMSGASAAGRDPIYPSQSPSQLSSNSSIEDSVEGFRSHRSSDVGIPNLENTENFGSRFQMPDASTSDNFLTDPRPASPAGDDTNEKLAFANYDIQGTLKIIQDLILKIRANLENPEQKELESLLREGAELLTSQWAHIARFTGTQVSDLKREIKENPYQSLISAVKIGMAISQVYAARKQGFDSVPG